MVRGGDYLVPDSVCLVATILLSIVGGEALLSLLQDVPSPRHNYHDQRSGLAEIYLRFAMPILILRTRSRYQQYVAGYQEAQRTLAAARKDKRVEELLQRGYDACGHVMGAH
jgi:hypothetical protein